MITCSDSWFLSASLSPLHHMLESGIDIHSYLLPKTKHKVDLISSHSYKERDNGPLAARSTEGSAVSDLYKSDRVPTFMRYLPKEGEQLVYEEIFIPDVN
jgi:hypothetical protein